MCKLLLLLLGFLTQFQSWIWASCNRCLYYMQQAPPEGSGPQTDRREAYTNCIIHFVLKTHADLLEEVDRESMTLCFDMMQNLVLPRTLSGHVYYFWQLYVQVIGVVHHGKDSTPVTDGIHLIYIKNKKDGT